MICEPFFSRVGAPLDPSNESLNEYLTRSAAQGHYCCQCPKQEEPMPCCNPGHAEAVARLRAVQAMEEAP